MARERTSSYRVLERRGPWWRAWHTVRRLSRLHPAWPWWALWVGGATAVTGALDLAGVGTWWFGPPIGLLLAVGVLGLTMLDDVTRPLASLRVLATELRDGPTPRTADVVRARVFDIPLYAPPPGAADDIRLTGGGVSYGPRLLTPSRRRLRVSWSDPDSNGTKESWATTVVDSEDRDSIRWLYDGQVRTHPVGDLEDPGELRIDEEEVCRQAATLEVVLEGARHEARAADLRPWGAGWAATLRLDTRHRLDLCGTGPLPGRLELVRCDPVDLVPERPRRGRGRS